VTPLLLEERYYSLVEGVCKEPLGTRDRRADASSRLRPGIPRPVIWDPVRVLFCAATPELPKAPPGEGRDDAAICWPISNRRWKREKNALPTGPLRPNLQRFQLSEH